MAEWNPYNSYWQYPYGAQLNYDYSHGTPVNALTFDYNHQTAAATTTTVATVSSPPPPPGIDHVDNNSISEANDVSKSLPNSDAWNTPSVVSSSNSSVSFSPYSYPYTNSGYPQPQVPRQAYPGYNVPPSPWAQPYYAYPPYQQPGMLNSYQGWSYPPPYSGMSAPATGVGISSPTTLTSIANMPTTFGNPAVAGPISLQETPAALKAKGTKEQWSDELKEYVQRAFCSIDTTEEKDQMERILKEKLEYIFRNNIKVDWTKENIPTIPSKALAACRNAVAFRPSSVNVVRPVHLFTGLRSARNSGGTLRLPVGVLARGGGRGLSSTAGAPNKTTNRAVAAAAVAAAAINRQIAAKSATSPVARPRCQKQSPLTTVAKRIRKRSEQVTRRSYSRSRSSRSSLSSGSRESRHSTGLYSSRSSSPTSTGGGHSRRSRRRPRSVSRSRSRSGSRKVNFRYYNKQRSPPPRGSGLKRGRGSRGASTISKNVIQRDASPDRFDNSPSATATPSGYARGATRGSGRPAGRRGGKQRKAGAFASPSGTSDLRLSQRANRFKDHLNDTSVLASGPGTIARTTSQVLLNYMGDERDDLTADFAACQIVGTNQELEKPYLRLTRAPEPGEVRPLNVLKLSLEHVKKRGMEKKDYRWVCEQFKSIRQDITVQCIEDEFAALVYETHADAALDAGDYEEFHQCQSQLLRLYKDGLASNRLLEFTAYRLLYYIFTIDQLGITTILAGLRPAHKSNPSIRFALDVRSAWSLSNYRRFFHLICPPPGASQPPLRCGQVVQWFIGRERKEALKTIFKVYRPHVSLQYIAESLGFDAVDDCKQFICEEFALSADLLEPLEKLDCKAIWGAMCVQTTTNS